mgnify:CR=1 FL=1
MLSIHDYLLSSRSREGCLRGLIMSLSSEAVENAAKSVLEQLAQRLKFAKQQRNDESIECLQFGICTAPVRIKH